MRYGLCSMPRADMSPVARPGGEGNAQPASNAAAAATNAAPLQISREPPGARSGRANSDVRAMFGLKLDIASLCPMGSPATPLGKLYMGEFLPGRILG